MIFGCKLDAEYLIYLISLLFNVFYSLHNIILKNEFLMYL